MSSASLSHARQREADAHAPTFWRRLENNGGIEPELTASEVEQGVVARLAAARVVPVTTVENPDQVYETCHALMRGGVACIEIAFRTPAAAAALAQACELEGMVVGAGTVVSPEQAHAAAQAGAKFAVAPGTNDDVVRECQKLGLPFFPGVATPSEIEHARGLGLSTLKVFPASTLGGPDFLRAVSATYPDVGFIPTGGIGPDNLGEYLAVPSVIACGGSWLVKGALLEQGRFDEIERLARNARELAA